MHFEPQQWPVGRVSEAERILLAELVRTLEIKSCNASQGSAYSEGQNAANEVSIMDIQTAINFVENFRKEFVGDKWESEHMKGWSRGHVAACDAILRYMKDEPVPAAKVVDSEGWPPYTPGDM